MKQKTKIFLSSLALIFGAILLTGAGCAKKEPTTSGEENATGGIPATRQTDTAKEGDIGIMNDDLYIEIQAQMSYHVSRDDLYVDWANGGYEKFLASQGVTEEQLTAYAKQILDDPNPYRASEITEKIGKRLEELSK